MKKNNVSKLEQYFPIGILSLALVTSAGIYSHLNKNEVYDITPKTQIIEQISNNNTQAIPIKFLQNNYQIGNEFSLNYDDAKLIFTLGEEGVDVRKFEAPRNIVQYEKFLDFASQNLFNDNISKEKCPSLEKVLHHTPVNYSNDNRVISLNNIYNNNCN